MLEEVESVVEVDTFVGAEVELGDDFVTIRVKHSQMVHNFLQIVNPGVPCIEISLFVVLISLPSEHHIAGIVQSNKGTQNPPGGQHIRQDLQRLGVGEGLGPSEDEDKGFVWAVFYDAELVVAA